MDIIKILIRRYIRIKWFKIEEGDSVGGGVWEDKDIVGNFEEYEIYGYSEEISREDLTDNEYFDLCDEEKHNKLLVTYILIKDFDSGQEKKIVEYYEIGIEKDERVRKILEKYKQIELRF